MDIRSHEWFAQMQLTGIKDPVNTEGSVLEIVGHLMSHLRTMTPRKLSDGTKRITIIIDSQPIKADGKADIESETQRKVREIEAGLEIPEQELDDSKPRPGESVESYRQRLIEQGFNEKTADFLACDWFNLEQSPELTNWLNDPLVTRFTYLNTNQSAFEKASVNEYLTLKQHIIKNHPTFANSLTFRVA